MILTVLQLQISVDSRMATSCLWEIYRQFGASEDAGDGEVEYCSGISWISWISWQAVWNCVEYGEYA